MCVLALVVYSASALFAQRALSADEIAASGSFDGQMYTNKALGLSILAPGGWTFFTYDRNQALVVKNRAAKRNSEAAQTQVLFQAAPSKLLGEEKSAIFSAGVQVLTEKTTPQLYAMENRDGLALQSDVAVTRDVTEVRYPNITLTAFEITGKAKGVSYRQVYWVTIRKGVAVFFVETFYDNKNTFATEASLKTLKFGK
jgi:hypothetical protein